ncbi:hypothetical protein C7E12_06255 [Stenotrophomonas maltophilia]|nr:hypothetical protein C7E12_06255 [Stenotrophomonas maltophilia]
MHHPRRTLVALLVLANVLASAHAAADERSLDGVNFTGPLITPNPAGLPQGNWYIEPYLVRIDSRDHYDDGGHRRRSGQRSGAWATVVPIIYGFSDRVMGQVNLSASRSESGGARSSGFRAGDTTARLQYLLQAPNPHILTLAPPPSLEPKWWGAHTGYTLAKMGMSFVTLGLAAEFGPQGVAVNALWPRTVIATDAINMIPGVDAAGCRTPQIMADAAHAVLVREAAGFHGQFLIDDEVLAQAGVSDLSGYAVDPSRSLLPDLFLD